MSDRRPVRDFESIPKHEHIFNVPSEGFMTIVALFENIRHEVIDKRTIEHDNNRLSDKIREERKCVRQLADNITDLYADIKELTDEVDQCDADIEEHDNVIEHKINTIKHQKDIIALNAENKEHDEECIKHLTDEVETAKKNVQKLEDECLELTIKYRNESIEAQFSEHDLDCTRSFVERMSVEVKRKKRDILMKSKAFERIEQEIERKACSLALLEEENELSELEVKQIKRTIEELSEDIEDERKDIEAMKQCAKKLEETKKKRFEEMKCNKIMENNLKSYYKNTSGTNLTQLKEDCYKRTKDKCSKVDSCENEQYIEPKMSICYMTSASCEPRDTSNPTRNESHNTMKSGKGLSIKSSSNRRDSFDQVDEWFQEFEERTREIRKLCRVYSKKGEGKRRIKEGKTKSEGVESQASKKRVKFGKL